MLVFGFWIVFFCFLLALVVAIIKRYESRNIREFSLKIGVLGLILVIGTIVFLGMLRYSASLSDGVYISEQTSPERRMEYASSYRIRPSTATILANDPREDIRYALATNPYLPKEAAKILIRDVSPLIRKTVIRSANTSLSTLKAALKEERDAATLALIQQVILERERIAEELEGTDVAPEPDPRWRLDTAFERYPATSETGRRIRLITNNTSRIAYDAFISDPEPDVRYAVALQPLASGHSLELLLTDPDKEVARMAAVTLARKSQTTPFMLDTLSRHASYQVRRAVASHPSTQPHTMEKLAQDKVPFVVKAVAQNLSTPEYVLEQLAQHKSTDIRALVASHPKATATVLQHLYMDDNKDIRLSAAQHATLTSVMQSTLAKDESAMVRATLARNPAVAVHLLRQLADDKDEQVRMAVAQNPSTDASTITQLAQDPSPLVRHQAEQNISGYILQLRNKPEIVDHYTRRRIAQHPQAPEDVLDILAIDPDVHVRERVALNPKTPKKTLQRMLEDIEPSVQQAVRSNPNFTEDL